MTASITSPVTESIATCFSTAPECSMPFRHWELNNMLPEVLTEQILAVRIPKTTGFVYDGTRASDSQVTPGGSPPERLFIGKQQVADHPHFQGLIDALLSDDVINVVNERFTVDTKDLFLRVEYINDFDGFFLEPHKDILEKHLSLLLYLGEGPTHMGTDFYDADLKVAKTSEFKNNCGYVFIRGDDTWHGLERKPIPNRRCSLLVNYVTFKTDWPVGR